MQIANFMNQSFFKFRAKTIKEWRAKIGKPTLIGSWQKGRGNYYGNRGHIRYSQQWYDYERALKDFNEAWFGMTNPPYCTYHGYYKRIKFMNRKSSVAEDHRIELKTMDLFEETQYGKITAKIRQPISPT